MSVRERAGRPRTSAYARLSGTLLFVVAAFTLVPSAQAADGRAYELVSPIQKNGGRVDQPETDFGGGAFQAAVQGGALTYSSAFSFSGAAGSPGVSQYLSRRSAEGWSTENLTVDQFSASYDVSPGAGAPYRLFSTDLATGVLTNGRRCRGEGSDCPVANDPLPGSGAPAGYRNYYLRDNADGSFAAVLSISDLAPPQLGPADFEVQLAGATPDLAHVVLSSCAALTADATEVPGSEGECAAAEQNLYEWSGGALTLINKLPAQSLGTPGAVLSGQSRAISTDGSRVYFTELEDGPLYLHEAGLPTKLVPETLGGGASFQTATPDGSLAFFVKGGHLYRYSASVETATDLTSSGGVQGVLGASDDGAYVYFQTAAGIFLWHTGTTTRLADPGEPSNYPPSAGTSRISADGTQLVFISAAKPEGFDNKGFDEVYLYSVALGAGPASLTCVSCNTRGVSPVGDSTIPGAYANGDSFKAYKPRVLSSSADRLFFDSNDALINGDNNGEPDVYQWEREGTGSCSTAPGCLGLISSGRGEDGARFIDASADGGDAFFTTSESLVASDPGAVDLYDARIGGGFPIPVPPIDCIGDACQPLPGEPEDPTPGTLLRAGGNEPLPHSKPGKKCKKSQVRKKGKCVTKKPHRKNKRGRR